MYAYLKVKQHTPAERRRSQLEIVNWIKELRQSKSAFHSRTRIPQTRPARVSTSNWQRKLATCCSQPLCRSFYPLRSLKLSSGAVTTRFRCEVGGFMHSGS